MDTVKFEVVLPASLWGDPPVHVGYLAVDENTPGDIAWTLIRQRQLKYLKEKVEPLTEWEQCLLVDLTITDEEYEHTPVKMGMDIPCRITCGLVTLKKHNYPMQDLVHWGLEERWLNNVPDLTH